MTRRKKSTRRHPERLQLGFVCLLTTWIVLVMTASLSTPIYGQRRGMQPPPREPLSWRFVGPQGNRVSAVVCDSNDLNVYYAGACAGGV